MNLQCALLLHIHVWLAFSGQPEHPSLPRRFSTHIEANIRNKNNSINWREWFDQDLEKGKREIFTSNYVYTIIEDFSDGKDEQWIYKQYANDRENSIGCTLSAYSSTRNLQTANSDESTSYHMRPSQAWLSYYGLESAEYQKIVGGNDYNVRGSSASKWKTHWYNVTMDKTDSGQEYFNIADYDILYYFSLGNNSVPKRVEVNGTRLNNYTNGTTS